MNRDCHQQLCTALLRQTAPSSLIQSRARPWASVTFSGARHWLTLSVAPEMAARLSHDLPDAEFNLPSQLVADIAVVGQQAGPDGVLIDIEALTVIVD